MAANTNPFSGGLLKTAMANTQQVTAPTTSDKTAQVDLSSFAPGAQNATKTTATGYDAAQAAVAKWSPDAPQTVQGQLKSVIGAGSPLLDQATTRANQNSARRGLLNSSMALGAAESALYDAALPIAQADAGTYANAGQYNAEAENTTNRFNADGTNNARAFTSAAGNRANEVNAGAENTLQSQLIDTSFRGSSQNAASVNDANARDAEASLRAQGLNQDATGRVVSQQADITSREGMQQADLGATAARQQADLGATAARQQADLGATAARQQADLQAQENRQLLDQAFRESMQAADAGTRVQLQQMQGDTQKNLAEIEANYRTLMQTNQSAGDLYQQTLKNITDIMMNKDLNAAAKQAAINQQSGLLGNGLNLLGKVSNLNLGDILQFTDVAAVPDGKKDKPEPPSINDIMNPPSDFVGA